MSFGQRLGISHELQQGAVVAAIAAGTAYALPQSLALCTYNQESQMSSSHIFWPVLAQILLTLVMFIVFGARKAKAVKAGRVNRKEAALDNRVWPEDVVKVSNNIANQFEYQVLFYVL